MMRICRGLFVVAMALCAVGPAVAFEKVPSEVAKALKGPKKVKVETGLVFIDGKYLKPPYRIECYGNQILINDQPVTGPLVPWEDLVKTQPPSNVSVEEVEVKDEPPAEKKAPPAPAEKDGDDPAAPKDGGNAPPPADGEASVRVTIKSACVGAEADDLEDFQPDADGSMKLTNIPKDTEEDKARQKRAEEDKEEEEEAPAPAAPTAAELNAAVPGEDVDPASPEGEAAAKAAAAKQPKPVVKTRKVYTLKGPFEENARSRKLMKKVTGVQNTIALTLKRGGYVFIGTGAKGSKPYLKGLRSDSVATKELLKKLPDLMSKAKDPESFCDAVRTAGLFSYVNLQISQDLYRHKTSYFELKKVLKQIEDEEKLKNMLNNGRGR